MSMIKRWFEKHVHEISDEVLREWGYSDEDIKLFRESFPGPNSEEELG